jgi:hypothetical protein
VPVWANFAASGMWYQSVSARSIPAARLPSVGTAQAAATPAQARAASTFAIEPESGAGGAGVAPGERRRSTAGAVTATRPASTPAAAISSHSP